MAHIWFTAVETFGSHDGEAWQKYLDFSGLRQLTEVVSLDGSLCPAMIGELIDEDWDHNVHRDRLTCLFKELDYLLSRVKNSGPRQILAVMLEPEAGSENALTDERFAFVGFDLLDEEGGNSALANCGGFPLAFDNEELSLHGLITDFGRAKEVQSLLRVKYPDERHARCHLWAVWRMKVLA